MSKNIKILKSFIKEFNETYTTKEVVYDNTLAGEIKKVQDKLLNEKFLPSRQLENILNKQLRKARYPMEVAITGQFSAGKSTFLNALLSRNILPTGITPVTSKVNFINYGEEYKLKITYYSGAQEYAPIESISDFTDQRQDEMKDMKESEKGVWYAFSGCRAVRFDDCGGERRSAAREAWAQDGTK